MLKEQENKILESLIIDSDAQINYFVNQKLFYYAQASYDRNIEYGIDDKTTTNVGVGYKDYKYKLPYRVQGGIASQSIFYSYDDTDREIFLKLGGDITIPYKFLALREDVDFLREAAGNNIELNSVSAIIANVSDNFFLSFSLNFSYLSDPPLGYANDIKIWMLRGGINF